MNMICRFSLYGFLKNFDFSEPFIILFYLSLGLSYFQIGVLTAFLHIVVNLTEIPSVAFTDNYRFVFVFSLVPAIAGLWNMSCYPDELNYCPRNRPGLEEVFRHSVQTVKTAFTDKDIRALIVQNTGFEGCFNVSKDFLQPLLKAQALIAAAAFFVSDKNALALIVASVYFVLYILSAFSSRKAYSFAGFFKTEKTALVFLLFISAALLLISSAALCLKQLYIAIAAFMLLFIVKNIRVPIYIGQYDNYAKADNQAAVLSIASQAKAIGISLLASLAGLCADRFGIYAALLFLSIVLGATAAYSFYRR